MQVTLSALMSGQEAAALSASFAGVVQRLASGGLGGAQTSVLGQFDGQAALVDSHERQLARLDLEGSAAMRPEVRGSPPAGCRGCGLRLNALRLGLHGSGHQPLA